jgi:hypothetical protein
VASGAGSPAVLAIMYLYQDDTAEIRRTTLESAAPSPGCFLVQTSTCARRASAGVMRHSAHQAGAAGGV